jgi:hypothetical protein
MSYTKILDEIYNQILKSIITDEINVFLCGKNTGDPKSIRNILSEELKKNPRINIFYPEWLFPNLLEETDEDLISLETILANDVDKIILPLEGYGAICELGAFSINKDIRDKIIVLNEYEHSREKSFINLGPIKLIKKRSKGTVIIYKDILSNDDVNDIRNKVVYSKFGRVSRNITNLFTLNYLVGLIIALFQPIGKNNIEKMLTEWKTEINVKLVDPAIESLIEYRRAYVFKKDSKQEYFSLTKEGKEYYDKSIKFARKQKNYYKLRSIILWTKTKSHVSFNSLQEKAKLLERSTD